MKLFATGRVTVFVISPDGTRHLIFKNRANTLGSNMVGRLNYYTTRKVTSSPVTHVRMKYGSTYVNSAGITNGTPTAYSTTGYQWLSTGSWQNTTGAGVTITDFYLQNRDVPGGELEYATLGGQSVAVGIGATIEVQWTMILRQNSSGGTGMPVAFFNRMCTLFTTATTTSPFTTARYTAQNALYVDVAMGDPLSGSDVDSTATAWQMVATAPAGATTLASIKIYDDAETPLLCDEQAGLSNTWVAATNITDTATLTWETV